MNVREYKESLDYDMIDLTVIVIPPKDVLHAPEVDWDAVKDQRDNEFIVTLENWNGERYYSCTSYDKTGKTIEENLTLEPVQVPDDGEPETLDIEDVGQWYTIGYIVR